MLIRYWQTLRHLEATQVAWRLRYRLARVTPWRRIPPLPAVAPDMDAAVLDSLRNLVENRSRYSRASPDDLRAGRLTFLNIAYSGNGALPWQDCAQGRLWLYQLHYFDYARQLAEAQYTKPRPGDAALVLGWIHDWIARNPAGTDVAWDAFCVSARLINWTLAESVFRWNDPLIRRSIMQQLAWLQRHLEWDIRANHLLKNAVALVAAGRLMGDTSTAAAGRELLEAQVREQILPDGGHYERCPMYHALVMEDLLAARAASGEDTGYLPDALSRMARWAEAVCHPNGDIPLFGDSVLGEALPPRALAGLAAEKCADVKSGGAVALPESGFYVIRWGSPEPDCCVLLKACGPEPRFQPGHAHADPFTFELSLSGFPVVVDTGVHGYAESPWRPYCRGVRAHNCAMVNGGEPMDAWGVFRVGRRYRAWVQSWSAKRNGAVRFIGAHDGYTPWQTEREVRADGESGVWIEDRISGAGEARLESSLHLAPECTVKQEGSVFRIERGGARLWLSPGSVTTVQYIPPCAEAPEGWHFPRFGVGIPAGHFVLTPTKPGANKISYALVSAKSATDARTAALKLETS